MGPRAPRHRRRLARLQQRFWCVALLAPLSAAGCAGQSGSELGPKGSGPASAHTDSGTPRTPPGDSTAPGLPPRAHCPCDVYRDYQPIHAQVVASQAFPQVGTARYELLAKELLGPAPNPPDELQVGDHFGGYWDGSLGCGGRIQIRDGDDVLAFYRRGMQDGAVCCEYLACEEPCLNALDAQRSNDDDATFNAKREQCEQDCRASSQAACALHHGEAQLRGELLLIPWGDDLVVGSNGQSQVSITLAQLTALQKPRNACVAELPDLSLVLNPAQPAASGSDANAASSAADGGAMLPAVPSATPAAGPTPVTPPSAPSTPASNPSGASSGPPPAGPEEVRVRCAALAAP
jgi:hypothetical protein